MLLPTTLGSQVWRPTAYPPCHSTPVCTYCSLIFPYYLYLLYRLSYIYVMCSVVNQVTFRCLHRIMLKHKKEQNTRLINCLFLPVLLTTSRWVLFQECHTVVMSVCILQNGRINYYMTNWAQIIIWHQKTFCLLQVILLSLVCLSVNTTSVRRRLDFSATWGVTWYHGLIVWNVKFSLWFLQTDNEGACINLIAYQLDTSFVLPILWKFEFNSGNGLWPISLSHRFIGF